MKYIINLFVSLFSFAILNAQPFKIKKIKVEGIITNYVQNENNKYITLKTYTVDERGGGVNKIEQIKVDGKFSFETEIPYFGDALLTFESKTSLPFFILAKETKLEIDYKVFQSSQSLANATKFIGKYAKFNMDYVSFWQNCLQKKFINNPDKSNIKQTNLAFSQISQSRLNEEIQLLQDFCKEKNEVGTYFYNCISKLKLYERALDVSYFIFSKRNASISYEELLQLVSFAPLQCETAYYNSDYFSFLGSLSRGFHFTTNTQKQYTDSIKMYGGRIEFTFYKLKQLVKQPILELMAFNLANSFLSELNRNNKKFSDTALFNSLVSDSYLRNIFNSKNHLPTGFKKYNVIDSLLSNPETISIANKLKEAMSNANANFLYIDFWGTWCKPCLQELPYYNELIQSLATQKIEFIFLATDTEENAMNKTKTEFGINKTFLQLNDNERNLLNKYFKFSSYPSHFLLNKKGEIIEHDFPPIKYQEKLNIELTNFLIKIMELDK